MLEKKLEKVGQVFETETYYTKCDCGEVVSQQYFWQTDGCGEIITGDCFIGFCKCGNVFISQKPQQLEQGKTIKVSFNEPTR